MGRGWWRRLSGHCRHRVSRVEYGCWLRLGIGGIIEGVWVDRWVSVGKGTMVLRLGWWWEKILLWLLNLLLWLLMGTMAYWVLLSLRLLSLLGVVAGMGLALGVFSDLTIWSHKGIFTSGNLLQDTVA